MSGERRYTLDEARRELAVEWCASEGHDYEFAYRVGSSDPVQVVCERCGRSWVLVESAR